MLTTDPSTRIQGKSRAGIVDAHDGFTEGENVRVRDRNQIVDASLRVPSAAQRRDATRPFRNDENPFSVKASVRVMAPREWPEGLSIEDFRQIRNLLPLARPLP